MARKNYDGWAFKDEDSKIFIGTACRLRRDAIAATANPYSLDGPGFYRKSGHIIKVKITEVK